jgi:tetrahydromethanopterin S-methyltransferase subunit G
MADNDNKELMEFLGKQFEGIYKRLDNTDKRLDNTATKDDLANLATKDDIEDVKRQKEENEREHARLEKMTLINTSDISRLDQRVGRLEGKA